MTSVTNPVPLSNRTSALVVPTGSAGTTGVKLWVLLINLRLLSPVVVVIVKARFGPFVSRLVFTSTRAVVRAATVGVSKTSRLARLFSP